MGLLATVTLIRTPTVVKMCSPPALFSLRLHKCRSRRAYGSRKGILRGGDAEPKADFGDFQTMTT
jgi:hypothetical protein